MPRGPRCAKHGNVVCSMCLVADDAARRCWEQVKNVAHHTDYETRVGSYLAIKLSDGSTDGVLYGSKKDAVRHCKGDEQWFAFFSFRTAPAGFASPQEAGVFLAYHRMAYDNGFRLPDPDDPRGGPDLVMPTPEEHIRAQLAAFMRAAVN